ncbi:hypothetical protein BLNAU_6661 [Blattamonas nauphoetae]|uniref:Uncharacterized protein n=1 Tax=Blattamonas nauphoetae TaxID=2049346 RepID=A0ABQ9Y3R8_9EUKA|nr:hypothetical protein BLNAU_6661 [Blattamonas nauphoetae]
MNLLQERLLSFDAESDLSFEDKSTLYSSLVSLIQEKCVFDDTLQDKTVVFLKHLGPYVVGPPSADVLITELVPSTDGSSSGFVDSACILLSSPHARIVSAVLNLPIGELDTFLLSINTILYKSILLTIPSNLNDLKITDPSAQHNRRQLIFQRVIQPSSQYITFHCQNRYILGDPDLSGSSMDVLGRLASTSPFHIPTLEFILERPVVMTIQSYLSLFENLETRWTSLLDITLSLTGWKKQGPETDQLLKRMIQALFSEGFEDTLEVMLLHDKDDEGFGDGILEQKLTQENLHPFYQHKHTNTIIDLKTQNEELKEVHERLIQSLEAHKAEEARRKEELASQALRIGGQAVEYPSANFNFGLVASFKTANAVTRSFTMLKGGAGLYPSSDGREGKRTLKLSQDGQTQPTFFSHIPVPFRFVVSLANLYESVTIEALEVVDEPQMVGATIEVPMDE